MTKGGLIIRLIDVALILLLGFIAISDIRIRAQVKLPSPGKGDNAQQESQIAFIRIASGGRFSIRLNGNTIGNIPTINELEIQLLRIQRRCRQDNQQMVVLVEPDKNSIVQLTVDVLDLCEKHLILKNITYQSLEL